MKIIPYGKQTIDEDDINSVIEVLKSDFLTTGPKVKEFEEALCKYTNAKYCLAVSSATAALHLSSLVLLKEDDLVLTTPNSFLATSNSILYAKAKPLFVDIKEDGNINLELCEKMLLENKNIKALYVVHFSGNPINQEKLRYLRKTYKVLILEDCAHSLGASINNIKAGSCENSDISVLSFHPVKQLTTGEGGAILTNNKDLYEKVLLLRNHGMTPRRDIAPWHYDMTQLGFNYRLTDIACALGLSQIKKVDLFIEKRRILAKRYDELLKSIDFIKPLYSFTKNSSYHLYVALIDFDKFEVSKKELFLKLREKSIFLQYHYIPINKQVFYKNLAYGDENHPVMNKYYKQAVSLPIYPTLSFQEQDFVIKCIKDILWQK